MKNQFYRAAWTGVLAFALSCPVVAQVAPASRGTQPAQPLAGPAELILANRHIITLRKSIGALTPAERVAGVHNRIKALDRSDLEQPVVSKETDIGGHPAFAIQINDRYLIGILRDEISTLAGEPPDDIVRKSVAELNAAREAYLELNRGGFIARQIGLAAAALFTFALAWYLLLRLYRQTRGRVRAAAQRHVARFSARGLNLTSFAAQGAERALATIYCMLVALGAYLCLAFGLRLFTYTHPWGDGLNSWLIDLLLGLIRGVAAALPGLFAACVIFFLAWLLVRAMNGLLARVERGEISLPGIHSDTASATRSIAGVLIWLFALTVAFPYLPGSDSDVFKGISLFAGLMVTLGSSGIVGQWMAGMTLIYSRAMRQGDLVKIGDNEGVVLAVGLLSTKIRTPTGEEVTIPNSSLIVGSIRNFTRLSAGKGSRVYTKVTIGYDAPWRQVHAMLLEAAARTTGLRTEPKPFVLQSALSDFYVEYELVGRIDNPLERPNIMTRLHGHVQDIFNEHGVQILSPHFMTQPAAPVVVEKRNWYAPPAKAGDAPPGT